MVQPQPLTLTKLAAAEKPDGNVMTKLIGPAAEAVPMLLTETGIELVTPTVKAGIGPRLVMRSGAKVLPAVTVCPVTGVGLLLLVFPSSVVGTVPVNDGTVPTEAAKGVIGMVKPVVDPALKMLVVEQLTLCPVVMQPQPFGPAKLAGAVKLAGKVVVKTKGAVVDPLPILLRLTGSCAVWPTVSTGTGPKLEIMSATVQMGSLP